MEGHAKKTPGYCTRPGRRERERQQRIINNAIAEAMNFIAVEKKEYRFKKTYDRTFWGMRVETGGKVVGVKEKTFKLVYSQPQQLQQVQLTQDGPLTQKDLIDFVSKNPFYSKYPAEWILDSEGLKTSEGNPGKTIATLKRSSEGELYVSKIQVYIHPSAFSAITDFRQTLITGHEFIHVSHLSSGDYMRWFNEFGQDGARAISEYWAFKWQVDNEVRLGYSIGGQAGLDKWSALLPAGYKPR